MSPENYLENFKIITTEEGARKIFSLDKVGSDPQKYLDKAIEVYKESVSNNVQGVTFTFFLSKNKPYVLIVDSEGRSYQYDPESNLITRKEK